MGMYDTIKIDEKILKQYNIVCPKCGEFVNDFQTKDLYSFMEDYYLTFVDNHIRLRKLDDPNDKRFWHEYTQEELDEHNKKADSWLSNGIMAPIYRSGYWLSDAWKPENRNQRDMGQLPHQWVDIYTTCDICEAWIDGYKIKFTDGIVELIEKKDKK